LRKSFPQAELAVATGAAPVRWELVVGRGYARNTHHWHVELDDGRRAFVKDALDVVAAEWLRAEHCIYHSVDAPFVPGLLGWYDDGTTLIAIEDLTDAHWPPPWTPDQIKAVRAMLGLVASTRPPAGLRRLEGLRDWLDGWPAIAADREPVLSTGLCSRGWLDKALPRLREAAATCELAGEELLHLDVRSDNLCFLDGRVLLVDWNHACVGNALLDLVAWLPSLHLEGGPTPWELVPNSRGFAALMAGFFASRAGLPPPPTAPNVREFQRRQAEVALGWAARELDLPAPERPAKS
jgi:hypothetical protein